MSRRNVKAGPQFGTDRRKAASRPTSSSASAASSNHSSPRAWNPTTSAQAQPSKHSLTHSLTHSSLTHSLTRWWPLVAVIHAPPTVGGPTEYPRRQNTAHAPNRIGWLNAAFRPSKPINPSYQVHERRPIMRVARPSATSSWRECFDPPAPPRCPASRSACGMTGSDAAPPRFRGTGTVDR